ncbi:MAG: FKBP-type peptidyl-prolyl cis-trans isomerase [Polyangiaceae bacterium]
MSLSRTIQVLAFASLPIVAVACKTKDPNGSPSPSPSASATATTAAVNTARPEESEARLIPPPADVAAPPADAEKLASGLASKVIQKGTGKDHPKPEDFVKVHYTGWTKGGRMFDSSMTRNEPADFRLNEVIRGWTEGVALMVVGEKRRLWIPAAMAYGDHARGGAPSGDLTFDVELLEIKEGPKPPAVPEDVKAVPATAKKTASGLAYRILKSVKDGAHPKATDRVEVNYSGWTTDGKMFDSSVMRGRTATFGLNGVIKGWTEGLQLMKVGETARFWIPGSLAYGDTPSRPGAPAGMLVFDVDLIAIK